MYKAVFSRMSNLFYYFIPLNDPPLDLDKSLADESRLNLGSFVDPCSSCSLPLVQMFCCKRICPPYLHLPGAWSHFEPFICYISVISSHVFRDDPDW